MAWIELRKRKEYKERREAIDEALNGYWVTICEPGVLPGSNAVACEKVVLTCFRLLKYVRRQIGGINYCIDDKKIGRDVNDACGDFYSLGEGPSTSFQEESDVLEILSRSAYREMKAYLKKESEEEEAEDYYR